MYWILTELLKKVNGDIETLTLIKMLRAELKIMEDRITALEENKEVDEYVKGKTYENI